MRPHALAGLALLLACGDDAGGDGTTSNGTATSTTEPASSTTQTAGPTSSETDPSADGTGTSASTDPTTGDTGATDDSGTTGDPPPAGAMRCGDRALAEATPAFAAPVEIQANGGTGGTAAGDLDGDGRDELVAQIQFRIYDLDGDMWSSYQPLPNLDGRGNRFAGDIELADMDGDGDLDIVVPDSDNAGTQGAVSWFENDGALDGAWTEHEITTFGGNGDDDTVAHLSELEAEDIDGDGRVDVVVRDISHGVWILIATDAGWAPRIFVPTLPREGLDLWDLDGDGDLDIVLNGVWLQTPADATTDAYTLHPIVGMEDWYAPDLSTASVRDYACKVEAGDLDGDGRADIVITNSEELNGSSPQKPHGIAVYLQPADLVADPWPEVVVTDEHYSWHTLRLADYDFDGSLDLLTAISAVGTDSAPDEITVWLNDGAGASFAPLSVGAPQTVYQGAVGDADGDGDCDLFAPDHFNSGPIRYYENTTVP